ncbi:MAG: DNA polymerase I, partial [Chloroflexi bacterium]|nr:DNA polymerase I [Chloroflexota bacterium]
MSSHKPLLILFDGHALIHRAYHALPALSVTKTGEPTGAVYGFASMLLKVMSDFKPTHWAIALDSPAPTFRHEKFEQYKAHRPPAPDELKVQIKRVKEMINTFNLPSFEVPGYEADDIIGTICKKASEKGLDTIIVTGDTDTLQLVSPHVRVLTPRPGKRFSDTQIYDEVAVQERYELSPGQLADLKGLKGDPSDNIPGVPGIGEKTATKLIKQFGSIEGIYQHLDEVAPPKAQESLRQNEAAAHQSKELATIDAGVPIEFDLDNCRVSSYERSRVTELFRELEFTTLLSKLPEAIGAAVEQEVRPIVEAQVSKEAADYGIVDTIEALEEVIRALSAAESFTFDVETTSIEPRQAALVGISLSTSPGRAWYLPVGHSAGRQLFLEQVISRLKPLLEDQKTAKIAHNGKYDMTVLHG